MYQVAGNIMFTPQELHFAMYFSISGRFSLSNSWQKDVSTIREKIPSSFLHFVVLHSPDGNTKDSA